MIQLPTTGRDWAIAIISALVGFFFGGALIAFTQRTLKKVL